MPQEKKTKNIFSQLEEYPQSVIPLYKPEPPFEEVKDGFGFYGVLLLDTLTNKIQCHICGEWFYSLSSHLKNAHLMTTREYKEKFGLNMTTPLCSPSVSKKLSKNMLENHKRYPLKMRNGDIKKAVRNSLKSPYRKASIQRRNCSGRCSLQIISRLRKIAEENGGNISARQLRRIDYRLYKAIEYWFPTFNIAKEKAGIKKNSVKKRLGEKELIKILVLFYKKFHRFPSLYQLEKNKGLPCASTYIRHFGSYERAKLLAEKQL